MSTREATALDLLAEALPLLNPRRDRDPAVARALFVKVRAFLDRDALSAAPAKIRITKSSGLNYWYASFIGREFSVEKAKDGFFLVEYTEGNEDLNYLVRAADCEPVDDLPKASEAQS